jgi:hypothetical protein
VGLVEADAAGAPHSVAVGGLVGVEGAALGWVQAAVGGLGDQP